MLLGTLTASTAAIVLSASKAQAKDASEIARIAKAITVRIEGATQGSGVLVKKEGNRYTVLTAWHVVQDNLPGEEVGIITSDGKEHLWESTSLQRLGEVDMAVLTFTSNKNYQVANIGDVKKVKYQDQVYVAGFPLFDFINLKFESGEVVANAEVSIDQGYQLLYSNKTKPGMSGGVILNENAELVAIHGRGEIDRQKKNVQELITKTGINQGVPITFYKLFLNGLPVVVSKENATTAGDYLAQAKASQGKQGREQTVIRLVNESLKIQSNNDKAYFIRAYAKSYLDDHQGTIKDYNQALNIDPQNANAFVNRGFSKEKLGDNKGAISDYKSALRVNQYSSEAYYNIGIIKLKTGNYDDAISNFNVALRINNNNANYYINRGVAKQKINQNKNAILDFNSAIEINPNLTKAFNNRGISKSNLGNYKDAISDFNRALEIDTNYMLAYYNRAFAKNKIDDHDGSIKDYSISIKLDPSHINSYLNRGLSNYKKGNYYSAINDYNRIIEINPNHINAYLNRGVIKLSLKEKDAACIDFKKAQSLGSAKAKDFLASAEGAWCRNMPD